MLDLLFFHRGLNCLVAIELKVGEFEPEYLGKLNFYLEALDRDVRKGHEQPTIGVLLCAVARVLLAFLAVIPEGNRLTSSLHANLLKNRITQRP